MSPRRHEFVVERGPTLRASVLDFAIERAKLLPRKLIRTQDTKRAVGLMKLNQLVAKASKVA